MTRCSHPCLVEMKAFQVTPAPMQLVMELLPNGTLYDYLHSSVGSIYYSDAGDPAVQHRLRVITAYNIASALQTLHLMDPPIVHSDLKSPNVLLALLPHGMHCVLIAYAATSALNVHSLFRHLFAFTSAWLYVWGFA
jgi:serine/threonine protein kinase